MNEYRIGSKICTYLYNKKSTKMCTYVCLWIVCIKVYVKFYILQLYSMHKFSACQVEFCKQFMLPILAGILVLGSLYTDFYFANSTPTFSCIFHFSYPTFIELGLGVYLFTMLYSTVFVYQYSTYLWILKMADISL